MTTGPRQFEPWDLVWFVIDGKVVRGRLMGYRPSIEQFQVKRMDGTPWAVHPFNLHRVIPGAK